MSEKPKSKFESREKSNAELLCILTEYLSAHPHLRFSQALANLGLVKYVKPTDWLATFWSEEYYLESDELLKRVKEACGYD